MFLFVFWSLIFVELVSVVLFSYVWLFVLIWFSKSLIVSLNYAFSLPLLINPLSLFLLSNHTSKSFWSFSLFFSNHFCILSISFFNSLNWLNLLCYSFFSISILDLNSISLGSSLTSSSMLIIPWTANSLRIFSISVLKLLILLLCCATSPPRFLACLIFSLSKFLLSSNDCVDC